jgi:hypothetical protein
MEMPERSINSAGARFGFNGQEKVNEISGVGNNNTALFWEYDTRTGRRWNLDPVDQVSISNYSVNLLNPIMMNDPNGDNPIDPRTGKPMRLNLNRDSVYKYETNPKIKPVKDGELYKLADPRSIFGLSSPRKRDSPDGTWAEGAASNPHETNFEHTSDGAFNAFVSIFSNITNVHDARITGTAPNDFAWRQAAELGSYDFLDDRYAESELWKINQLEYNILSVSSNFITKIVHLDRPNDNSKFNVSSVTSFVIDKGDPMTKTTSNWYGGSETIKYRILTVKETTEKYRDNKPTGEIKTKN